MRRMALQFITAILAYDAIKGKFLVTLPTTEFESKQRVEGNFLQIFEWIRIANRVRTGEVH